MKRFNWRAAAETLSRCIVVIMAIVMTETRKHGNDIATITAMSIALVALFIADGLRYRDKEE